MTRGQVDTLDKGRMGWGGLRSYLATQNHTQPKTYGLFISGNFHGIPWAAADYGRLRLRKARPGRPFHSCPHGVDCSFDPGPRPVPRKAFVLTPSTPFSLSSSPLSALCLVVTQMVLIVSRAPRYQM